MRRPTAGAPGVLALTVSVVGVHPSTVLVRRRPTRRSTGARRSRPVDVEAVAAGYVAPTGFEPALPP